MGITGTSELIRAIAELGKTIAWTVGIGGAVAIAWRAVNLLIEGNHPFTVSYKGTVLSVQPAVKTEPPSAVPSDSPYAVTVAAAIDSAGAPSRSDGTVSVDEGDLPAVLVGKPLPSDYIYLNHTSFLRPEMQVEFTKRTNVALPHYDIRVKTESYYKDALERISYVEYVLHEAFPDPIQRRYVLIPENVPLSFCRLTALERASDEEAIQ